MYMSTCRTYAQDCRLFSLANKVQHLFILLRRDPEVTLITRVISKLPTVVREMVLRFPVITDHKSVRWVIRSRNIALMHDSWAIALGKLGLSYVSEEPVVRQARLTMLCQTALLYQRMTSCS